VAELPTRWGGDRVTFSKHENFVPALEQTMRQGGCTFCGLLKTRFGRDTIAGVGPPWSTFSPDRALGLARSVQKGKFLYMWPKNAPKWHDAPLGPRLRLTSLDLHQSLLPRREGWGLVEREVRHNLKCKRVLII
jgi:hypothetical protein